VMPGVRRECDATATDDDAAIPVHTAKRMW